MADEAPPPAPEQDVLTFRSLADPKWTFPEAKRLFLELAKAEGWEDESPYPNDAAILKGTAAAQQFVDFCASVLRQGPRSPAERLQDAQFIVTMEQNYHALVRHLLAEVRRVRRKEGGT